MKSSLVVVMLLLGSSGLAQEIRTASLPTASQYLKATQGSTGLFGWKADPMITHQFTSPWSTTWPATGPGNYWLSSTMTQSFQQGKFGTIYYYDMQSNMRYARTFLDISGKNKRGIKLLLPTINQRMFGIR
jgi:hypothetical protein